MFQIVIEGIYLGLFLAFLVGPLLMALVDTSINLGYKKGLILASGIWISDLLFIFLVTFFSLKMEHITNSNFIHFIAWISSLSFIATGILYLLNAKKNKIAKKWMLPETNFWIFIKGFLINTINPFSVVFWTSLATKQIIVLDYTLNEIIVFFSSIMVMIILTDSLKVMLAYKLKSILKPRVTYILSVLSGLIFITSGILILLQFVFYIHI
jgi:threonine/homoserine/homoserine lactone efflux protein